MHFFHLVYHASDFFQKMPKMKDFILEYLQNNQNLNQVKLLKLLVTLKREIKMPYLQI